MSEEPNILLPEPGSLRWSDPPHWHGSITVNRMTTAQLAAALLLGAAGTVLFGWYALRTMAISVAVALLIESAFHTLTQRSRRWSESQALLIGLLLACTLPATANWSIVVTGSAVAVLIGLILPGGVGNYLWYPVALGRIAVQLLYGQAIASGGWAVLAPGRMVTGDLSLARPLPPLMHWATAPLPAGTEAWQVVPTIEVLTSPLPAGAGASPAQSLADLIANHLPPWPDTLIGLAGGSIGEACVLAAIAAGLLLAWQGLLRWRMVAAALGAAAVAAAVLPVYLHIEGHGLRACWVPVRLIDDGLPVGLVYVAYQMTAGALPMVVLVLAADPASSPLTHRGQVLFGLVIGTAAMLLRAFTGLPASDYWALLAANTCVPVINRLAKRPIFGFT